MLCLGFTLLLATQSTTVPDFSGCYASYEYLMTISIRLTKAKTDYVVSGRRLNDNVIVGRFDPVENVIQGKFLFKPKGSSPFRGHWNKELKGFVIREDQGDAIMDYCLLPENGSSKK